MSAADAASGAAPAAGSVPRGIAAGAVAALVALPVTPVVWFVATIMKRTLYRKVMHQSISYDELHQHARGYLITGAAVAGATGLIAGAIAAGVALTLIKQGRRIAFQSTSAIGATLLALLVWRGLTLHGDPAGSTTLAILLAWLLGLAGLGLTEAALTTPDRRSDRL